ncbi:unnamed protein product, partial [Coregonus sp. 'balchen']
MKLILEFRNEVASAVDSNSSQHSSGFPLHSTAMPPLTTTIELYNRTAFCKWPCKCAKSAPLCPPGVSVLMDGCDCCKACSKQVGETCNEADVCDYHKGLYCDYSADKPRYEKGVCAYMVGTGCEYDGVIYRNGQSFQPSCKYRCLCVNGAIGCVPLCTDSQPPRVWCQTPKRTTSWSPCSKTCGRGLSLRISNANDQWKKCLNIYREEHSQNFTISGCTSKKPYRPKYCGVCMATDDRCCIPYKSKTIEVEFKCPNGATLTWQVMWINACF